MMVVCINECIWSHSARHELHQHPGITINEQNGYENRAESKIRIYLSNHFGMMHN